MAATIKARAFMVVGMVLAGRRPAYNIAATIGARAYIVGGIV